jgi:hypothetical protein
MLRMFGTRPADPSRIGWIRHTLCFDSRTRWEWLTDCTEDTNQRGNRVIHEPFR